MSCRSPSFAPSRPSLADLRAARDVLRSAYPMSAVLVADAIDAILHGADPLRALGLKGTAGHRSALTADRLHARDALIRQIAGRHYPGQSTSAQARQVAGAAAAYWRRAARLDRDLAAMPGSYLGTPRELLFQIARLPTVMPGERTIRAILSARVAPLPSSPSNVIERRLFPASASPDASSPGTDASPTDGDHHDRASQVHHQGSARRARAA